MGHERVGVLPRSIRWRSIVNQIVGASVSDEDLARLVTKTLENVRGRLIRIQADPGVKAAFSYLVILPNAALSSKDFGEILQVKFEDNPSSLRLTLQLRQYIKKYRRSLEYAEVAQRAAADAISTWTNRQKAQLNLFTGEPTTQEIWSRTANGGAFCEVARLFFASFIRRYLNYFLEREASAVLSNIELREQFSNRIREYIDQISRHAFETTRITQSFAAGWYNIYARGRIPNEQEIEGFLSRAFGKIQEELLREAKY